MAVKCPACGKPNEKETVVNYKKNGRYYCKECYEALLKKKEEGKSDYNKLYDYILELYKKPPTKQMLKQIKDYIRDDMTYYGVMMSLKYFHEYMENPIDDTKGIGIVPYVYDEAEGYFNKIIDTMEYNDTIELDDNIIIVKPSSDSNKLKIKRKITLDDKVDID